MTMYGRAASMFFLRVLIYLMARYCAINELFSEKQRCALNAGGGSVLPFKSLNTTCAVSKVVLC